MVDLRVSDKLKIHKRVLNFLYYPNCFSLLNFVYIYTFKMRNKFMLEFFLLITFHGESLHTHPFFNVVSESIFGFPLCMKI
jgi:hypothetical protein